MNPNEWKALKNELMDRGFTIEVKGRSKREFIASNDFMTVDIYRGGITGSGVKLLMYVFDSQQEIVCEIEDIYYQNLLKVVDSIINFYNETGEVFY